MPPGTGVRTAPARDADAELIERFLLHADEAAFAAPAGRYGPLVLGTCRRLLGHAQDAEDAAQAVFLVLARGAGRVRNRATLAGWLYGVAVRVCRKARARRQKRAAQPLPEGAAPAVEPPAPDDGRRVLDDALAELPESLRLPLVLCYLQGLTRDEAAERLGVSVSTFRGRLERGRDRLRAELLRRGFPLSAGLTAAKLSNITYKFSSCRNPAGTRNRQVAYRRHLIRPMLFFDISSALLLRFGLDAALSNEYSLRMLRRDAYPTDPTPRVLP